jgi:hypothetical protein
MLSHVRASKLAYTGLGTNNWLFKHVTPLLGSECVIIITKIAC